MGGEERTLAWLNSCRRLAKDWGEHQPEGPCLPAPRLSNRTSWSEGFYPGSRNVSGQTYQITVFAAVHMLTHGLRSDTIGFSRGVPMRT